MIRVGFTILCLFFCLSGTLFAGAQTDETPITAKDLEGEWVGLNYFCETPTPPQRMIFEAIGPKIVATKTLGDDCVPAGHRTFEGTLSGNTIQGVHYVSSGPFTSIYTIPITMTVNYVNSIDSSFGSQFRRGEGVEPEEVPDELGEIEVTVINKRTGRSVRFRHVSVTNPETGQTVGKTMLSKTSKGKASFVGIEPGTYVVAFEDERWSEATRKASATVEAGETTKVKLELDFDAVEVAGFVLALNKKNKGEDLRDVKVSVVFSDGHIVQTHTDDMGMFKVNYDKAPASYTLEATLASKGGEFTVRSNAGFGGALVRVPSRRFDIDKPRVFKGLFLKQRSLSLSGSLNAVQKKSVEHGGTYYFNTYTAMKFARDKLGLRFDHNLPVDATLWSTESTGATYFRNESKIEISGTKGQSERSNPSSPDNREYHEFGHHVMADSAMGGENTYTSRIDGEHNHGGISNGRSVDSVLEGFAEFFSIWVENDPVYNWGAATDLENNFQNMWRPKRAASGTIMTDAQGKEQGESVMREEFQVAALLWDLLDSNRDPGDYIDLTDAQMWAVINRVQIKDVPSIYREVRGPLRGQRTVPGSPLDDVDTLFVAHRFFSDVNGNGKWDTGEQIGVADFYHKRGSNTVRHNIPTLENSDIEFTLPADIDGLRQVQMVLQYPDGTRTDLGTGFVNDNRLTIEVPDNAKFLEIQPLLAGYSAQPIRITPLQYAEALVDSWDGDEATLLSIDVDVTPVDLSTPTDPTIDLDFDGLWIGWQGSGPQYVLVEGAVRAPEILSDGVELYRGSDRSFHYKDIEETSMERFFSVFTIDANGNVSKPLEIRWPIDGQDDDQSGFAWWLWLLIALVGLGIIWIITRRRKRDA